MKDRLRSSDYRFVAVCLVLLAGTTWFSFRNFYRAFPEASIDFRISREDGGRIASQFLTSQGYQLQQRRQASSFSYDDDAKTFLEREAGLEQANRIMSTRIRMWRWAYRWFRPLEKEEFRAEVTAAGDVVEFSHEIAEDTARNDPGAERARTLAQDFLRTRMHRDPAALEFQDVSDQSRPHRVDRVFTWKERDFDLHDATHRIEVTLLGDEVGGYREYLKVPEQWTRDYQRLRSKNETAQIADSAVTVVLIVALVIVIVNRVRRGDIRWRRAMIVGLIAMALSFLAHLNQFSQQEFEYRTTDSYSSFVAQQILQGALAALGWGGFLFVLAAGAEPLYRENFRGQISLGSLFRPEGFRTRRFFLGALLGIALTGIFIAYQTGFYIVAYRFGAWSPADVNYDNLLNTKFPWLFVLAGGYMPAVFEEFLFRMFAIPMLRKVLRSLAAAVVLAGFIWGFGHAGYPQQPFYIRGVEVGIGGVALGLVMLRWGILPTLVWHYSVDAMYSAMLLLRSHNLYFRVSGAISAGIIVLPVMLAIVAYWRKGGFEPETGLLNADESTAPEPPPSEIIPVAPVAEPDGKVAGYRPLSAAVRWAAIGLLAVGLALLAVRTARFGQSPDYKISDARAHAASDAYARSIGFDPAAYRYVTFPAAHWEGDDPLAGKYFLEREPLADASRMFERYRPIQHWVTRYFKSLETEEMTVSVHPETAKILGFIHKLPDARAGADLAPDAAKSIAENFAVNHGWELAGMVLKENSSDKKKARRDYTFEWEAPPGDQRNVDEAHFRVHIEVAGDQVSELRSYWKIPEAFERERSRQNVITIAVLVLRIAGISAVVIFAILLLVGRIRHGEVPWRVSITIGIPAALLLGLATLLSSRLMLANYPTAYPLETFRAISYITVAMTVIFGFVLLGAAAALVISNYPATLGVFRAGARRAMAVDAVCALFAAAGLALIVQKLSALALQRFHAEALFGFSSPDLIVNAQPAVAAIAGAVRSVLMSAAMLATLAMVRERFRKPWTLVLMVAGAAVVALPSVHRGGELGLHFALGLVATGAAAAFCVWFARGNYLAYFLVFWALALRGPISELFGNPLPELRVDRWVIGIALAALLAWAVYPVVAPKAEGNAVSAGDVKIG